MFFSHVCLGVEMDSVGVVGTAVFVLLVTTLKKRKGVINTKSQDVK